MIPEKGRHNLLLFCGFIAPLIFITSFFIQGIYKPGFNSLRHPVSSLSLGANGWIQVVTFIVTGLLIVCFSVEVQSRLKDKMISALFVLVGIGLIASGIFSTDPLFGYPDDQAMLHKEFTVHGKLHSVSALFVFIGIPILCFKISNLLRAAGKTFAGYYSVITGVTMLLLFVLTGFALNNFLGLGPWGGLIQRACIITGFLWISLAAVYLHVNKDLALPAAASTNRNQ